MARTYYELLGVPQTASGEEIEAAFRNRASEVHPDRVPVGSEYLKSVAAEAFKNLSEAKAVLLDPGKRQQYDEELARSLGHSAAKRSRATTAAASDFVGSPAGGTSRSPSAKLGFGALLILVCGALVLAGLLWSNLGSRPRATNPPIAVTPGNSSPPASAQDAKDDSSATQKKRNAPANREGHTALDKASSAGSPRPVTLWRASQPPDLAGLSSSDQLNIESACSYAKTQSPDEYNGCLAQQLAVHGTAPPPPDLSKLPASQREGVESACASTKLIAGPAAYHQCIAQQLELSKHRAP